MKLLLFDIDGTLLLTGGAGRIAFDKTFEDLFGIPKIWDNIIPDGKTDPIIIRELIEKAKGLSVTPVEYDALCRKYLEHFEKEIPMSERFRLMPGAESLIKELDQHPDLVKGIATGNFEHTARLKLRRAGLDSFFPFGGYATDSSERIELTEVAIHRGEKLAGADFPRNQVYVIGDTIHDIRAGKALGTKTVGVATGRTTREELAEASPDHLFEQFPPPKEFLKILG